MNNECDAKEHCNFARNQENAFAFFFQVPAIALQRKYFLQNVSFVQNAARGLTYIQEVVKLMISLSV